MMHMQEFFSCKFTKPYLVFPDLFVSSWRFSICSGVRSSGDAERSNQHHFMVNYQSCWYVFSWLRLLYENYSADKGG